MIRLSRRRLVLFATAVLVAAIALTALIGSVRGPAGPASGFAIPGVAMKPVDPGPTIVFAQYNIRTGRGPDDRRDLARTAECLKGMEVVGLNELRGSAWYGRPDDQAETLGRMLGLGYLYAPTERRFAREHFGNGLLTALPVTDWLRLPLPRSHGHSHRNILLAELQLPATRLRVLVTHVDSRGDRDLHLAAVAALFRTQKEPAVLIGDLNAGPEHPEIARLLAEPGVVASNGAMPPKELPGRVEWIIARGMRAVDASRCDNGASDHPRVALELATPQ